MGRGVARLRKSVFAKGVATLAGGSAIGQVIALALSPVLTRIYSAADFGVLSVYAAVLAVLSVVVATRYEQAIPLARRRTAAVAVLATSIVIGAATVLFVFVILSTTALVRWPNQWGSLDPVRAFWWLIPVGLAGAALYQPLSMWAVRSAEYRKLARTNISRSFSQSFIQVSAGLLHSGPSGLVVGHVAGQLAGVGSLLSTVTSADRRQIRRVTSRRLIWALRRYSRFPKFSSGASLLNMLALQLPAVFLAAQYDLRVAGWFALGQRLFALPARLIGSSVAQVYLSEAGRQVHVGTDALRRLYLVTGRRLAAIALLPTIVTVLTAPVVFRFVFGNEWHEAGVYVQILSLTFLASFVVSPLSQTLNVTGNQHWQLGWDATRTLSLCGVFTAAAMVDMPARGAIVLYSGVMFLAYIALYILCYISLRSERNVARD